MKCLASCWLYTYTGPVGHNFINLIAVGSGPVLGTEALELLSKFLLYSEHVIYPVVKKSLSCEIKEDGN